MKFLLTSASCPTSRQITNILNTQNHEIHISSSPGLHLTTLSSHSRSHPCPAFPCDPLTWLTTLLSILRKDRFDLLLCAADEVAILSAFATEIRSTGVRLAVPGFAALRRVMGRIAGVQALRDTGLAQPESAVILSRAGCKACAHLVPGWVKIDVGIGSRRVETLSDLDSVVGEWEAKGLVRWGVGEKLLLQKEVMGRLVVICGVFERGELRAWHAFLRERDGLDGRPMTKVGAPLLVLGERLAALGRGLDWHGGLSLDAVLIDGKPFFVGVKPGITEPMNALLSGVDLVGALVDVAFGAGTEEGKEVTHGTGGFETHQLLFTLLKKAHEGRRRVALEFFMAVMKLGRYSASVEDLTSIEDDWWSIVIVVFVLVALLVGGRRVAVRLERKLADRGTLSLEAWRTIMAIVDGR